MAEINFGLLDTQLPGRIATIPLQAQEAGQANALRTMQMMQGMQQNEASQMQLQKLRQDAAGVAEFSRRISAMGGPSDPMEIAQAFIAHPDPGMKKTGVDLMQKARAVAAYDKRYPSTPATAMPAAGSANALPGAVGANAAPTDVNQLLRQIQAEIVDLSSLAGPQGDPRANQRLATLNEREKELLKSHNVAPSNTLLRTGLPAYTAPAAKSLFETSLEKSDLTEPEKMVARRAMVGKESTTPPPEYIATIDRLGKTTDPVVRQQLLARLVYMTTHTPGTKVEVNAYTPASVEAQKDFMKSTRATYDTLKQSPAMFANIEASKKLIPAASVFMGTGGEGMKVAASFLNNRLGMSVNTEGVKNAEELRSRLFQGILASLKKLDSQPSERQQAALEQALGNLNTDPTALSNVLDAYADTVRNNIDTHNAEVQSAISRGVKFPYDPIIKVPVKAAGPDVYVRDANGAIRKQ